jgi:hypothetical protein
MTASFPTPHDLANLLRRARRLREEDFPVYAACLLIMWCGVQPVETVVVNWAVVQEVKSSGGAVAYEITRERFNGKSRSILQPAAVRNQLARGLLQSSDGFLLAVDDIGARAQVLSRLEAFVADTLPHVVGGTALVWLAVIARIARRQGMGVAARIAGFDRAFLTRLLVRVDAPCAGHREAPAPVAPHTGKMILPPDLLSNEVTRAQAARFQLPRGCGVQGTPHRSEEFRAPLIATGVSIPFFLQHRQTVIKIVREKTQPLNLSLPVLAVLVLLARSCCRSPLN